MAAYPGPMDEVFRALADPSRRLLLDSLNDRNGQTLRELCAGLDMARQSVSKHLAVLEAANLVTDRAPRPGEAPLPQRRAHQRDRRALDQPLRPATASTRSADLKRALEDTPMEKPSFVYTTYIQTTPERLWQALTEPAFTERYWGTTFESDWQVGSTITWHNARR